MGDQSKTGVFVARASIYKNRPKAAVERLSRIVGMNADDQAGLPGLDDRYHVYRSIGTTQSHTKNKWLITAQVFVTIKCAAQAEVGEHVNSGTLADFIEMALWKLHEIGSWVRFSKTDGVAGQYGVREVSDFPVVKSFYEFRRVSKSDGLWIRTH